MSSWRVRDRQRETRLPLDDAVQLPAAERHAPRPRPCSCGVRQLGAEADDEAMADVEERVAPFVRQRPIERRLVADRHRQHRPRLAADVQARHVVPRVAVACRTRGS